VVCEAVAAVDEMSVEFRDGRLFLTQQTSVAPTSDQPHGHIHMRRIDLTGHIEEVVRRVLRQEETRRKPDLTPRT
jgi:hypothetical protein